MKSRILAISASVILSAALMPAVSFAQADSAIEREELLSDKSKDNPEWVEALKVHHHLKDSQIKMMKEQGLTYPQMGMVSRLSEKSGKPVEDIIEMRTRNKLGWGELANELGVAPKDVSRAVAILRHEVNLERKIERMHQRLQKREARMAKKEAKREQRASGQ